jgi:hypothetical protein
MITTTKTRFAVVMTSPQGGVYSKDMVSGHWTTGSVRDMTRSEVDAVMAHEKSKGTCSTFEVVDLDVRDGLVAVIKAAREAVTERTKYHDIPYAERRDGELGQAIRAEFAASIKVAKLLAIKEAGLEDYLASLNQ